jgi:cobalt-zinc-cadmium resistance protein CzcA
MLERLLKFSIEQRWLVVLVTAAVGGLGVWSLGRLPIDAVPDITNNQVQINTLMPAFSPEQVERQVTFPVETALAGIPGLQYTRSLSRNGFSQVTAVFADDVSIYFARNQIGERLSEARRNLPRGAEPKMGPISTGLGEVYMWTVDYVHPLGAKATIEDGQPGWQTDGAYLTPEGQRLETEVELASYLREVQDWIIRPQLKNIEGIADIDVVGGYEKQYHVQPDPMKLVSYGLTFQDLVEALEKNNVTRGAGYVEQNGSTYPVRIGGLLQNVDQVAGVVVGQGNGRGGAKTLGHRRHRGHRFVDASNPHRASRVVSALAPRRRTSAGRRGGERIGICTGFRLVGVGRNLSSCWHSTAAPVSRMADSRIRKAKPVKIGLCKNGVGQ